MIVICLEGCHGCGKTELCNRFEFEKDGFIVLDESFLDMPEHYDSLHPQSLLMETFWVCSWFERILRHATEHEQEHKKHILITDRSPFSAVFYARNGHLLGPVIQKQMEEVKAAAGIEIITVHIKVDDEVLWSRIQQRLTLEPHRKNYKEDKKDWMQKVRKFYNTFDWDLEIDNTEHDETKSLTNLMNQLLIRFCKKSDRYKEAIKTASPRLHASIRKQMQFDFPEVVLNKKSSKKKYVEQDENKSNNTNIETEKFDNAVKQTKTITKRLEMLEPFSNLN